MNYKELAQQELQDKVWFMPTDTIPGISARISDQKAIDRIYQIKGRDQSKPLIILCSSFDQLELLDIDVKKHKQFLEKIWPGRVTVAFTETVSVRMPESQELLDLLDSTGPLVSTSCNRSGKPAILDKKDAQEEFGEEIDYYLDANEVMDNNPSTIIKIIR